MKNKLQVYLLLGIILSGFFATFTLRFVASDHLSNMGRPLHIDPFGNKAVVQMQKCQLKFDWELRLKDKLTMGNPGLKGTISDVYWLSGGEVLIGIISSKGFYRCHLLENHCDLINSLPDYTDLTSLATGKQSAFVSDSDCSWVYQIDAQGTVSPFGGNAFNAELEKDRDRQKIWQERFDLSLWTMIGLAILGIAAATYF